MSGVALMILASGFLSTMGALVKALGRGFPFGEAVMFRALIGLPLVVGLARLRGVSLRPNNVKLLLLRGLLGVTAMSCFFYALQRGLLADVSVIGRLQPVMVAIFAPLLIKERIPPVAALALLVSLAGAVMVIRPSAAAVNAAGIAAFAAAVLSALAHICIRRLNATDDPMVIVLYFTLCTAAGGAAQSIPVFVVPDARQLGTLIAIAFLATVAQVLLTTAYGRDRASVIAAAGYTQVVYALLYGYLFWAELPAAIALAGGGLITAAGVLLSLTRRGVDEPPTGDDATV